MNRKDEANRLINAHGGTTAVARKCDITPQAVSQWKRKGIPKPWMRFLQTCPGPAANTPQ